jgi:hypothetical protein
MVNLKTKRKWSGSPACPFVVEMPSLLLLVMKTSVYPNSLWQGITAVCLGSRCDYFLHVLVSSLLGRYV